MKMPNPSIPEFKSGGDSDPKKLLMMIIFLVVGFFVFVGDQVCFSRSSEAPWESLIAYPTTWGYLLFEDRFFADGFAFTLWMGGVGTCSYLLMSQIERRWIEPMMVRRTLEQLEREKKWVNKYGKNLF